MVSLPERTNDQPLDAFGTFNVTADNASFFQIQRLMDALRTNGTTVESNDSIISTRAGQLKNEKRKRDRLRELIEYLLSTSLAYQNLFKNTVDKVNRLQNHISNNIMAAGLGKAFSVLSFDKQGAQRYQNQLDSLNLLKRTRIDPYQNRLMETPLLAHNDLQDMNNDLQNLETWRSGLMNDDIQQTLPPMKKSLKTALNDEDPWIDNDLEPS